MAGKKKGKSKKSKKLSVKINDKKIDQESDKILDEELNKMNNINEQMNTLMTLKEEIMNKNIVIDKEDSTDSFEKELNVVESKLSNIEHNETDKDNVEEEAILNNNDTLEDLLISNDNINANKHVVEELLVSTDEINLYKNVVEEEAFVANSEVNVENIEKNVLVTNSEVNVDSIEKNVSVTNSEVNVDNIEKNVVKMPLVSNIDKDGLRYNECMRDIKAINNYNYLNILVFSSFPIFYYIGISKLFLILIVSNFISMPSKRRYYLMSSYTYYHFFGLIAFFNSLLIFSSYYLLNNTSITNMFNKYLKENNNAIRSYFIERKELIYIQFYNIRLFVKIKTFLNRCMILLDKYHILYLINYLNNILGYMLDYIKNGILRVVRDLSLSFFHLVKKYSFFGEKNPLVNKQKHQKINNNFFIDEFDNLDDLLMNDDEIINNFKNNNMGQQMDMLLGMMSQANTLMKTVGTLKQNNLRKRTNINSKNI
jgi:hypothetical protein